MRSITSVITIAALGLLLAAAIFVLYPIFTDTSSVSSEAADAGKQLAQDGTNSQTPQKQSNPLSAAEKLDLARKAQSNTTSLDPDELVSKLAPQEPLPEYEPLSAYDVARENLSDEEYSSLVERLRNDPVLMDGLLNELRSETDADRVKRLVSILGSTGSSAVLPVAEELVYSSDDGTRKSGLDLLSRVAPLNAEAYDVANNILGSEADPSILVSTMNVLAVPESVTPETRQSAVAQIIPLAEHDEPAVRRQSVSILVRLTNDDSLSPVLYGALSDEDPSVRQAAVYAYAQYPFQSPEAVERLFEIAEDTNEPKGNRRAAITTLNSMQPDEQVKNRIAAAQKTIR